MFCCSSSTMRHDLLEFSVENVKSIAEKECINFSDRIILSGGEPTIAKDFYLIIKFLHGISRHIVIYTNGRTNLYEIIKYAERIIIPIYGNELIHNNMTGIPVSYQETMKSIKTLLPKYSSQINLKFIFSGTDAAESIFNSSDYPVLKQASRFSFAGLVRISGPVETPRMYEIIENQIMKMLSDGKCVNIYDLPLCLFSQDFLQYVFAEYKPDFNEEYDIFFCKNDGVAKPVSYNKPTDHYVKCHNCNLNGLCSKIMQNYYCISLIGRHCWLGTE